MEEKVTIATENVFESFCVLDRYFSLGNFVSNISTEKLKICTEIIFTTNL